MGNLNWKHAVVFLLILGVLAYFFLMKGADSSAIRKAIIGKDLVSLKKEVNKIKTAKEFDVMQDDYKEKNGTYPKDDIVSNLGADAGTWFDNYYTNLNSN